MQKTERGWKPFSYAEILEDLKEIRAVEITI